MTPSRSVLSPVPICKALLMGFARTKAAGHTQGAAMHKAVLCLNGSAPEASTLMEEPCGAGEHRSAGSDQAPRDGIVFGSDG